VADIGPPLSTEWQAVNPDLVACCSKEPQNDTGNGQRLLKYFGNELLNVREAESARSFGWHYWTGQRWQFEGAAHVAALYAQRTAERIQLEAGYLTATRDEAEAGPPHRRVCVGPGKTRADTNHLTECTCRI
jgi:hypothetical protein